MFLSTSRVLLTCGVLALLVAGHARADGKSTDARESARILERFGKGNPGWKVRMQSLVQLAKLGPAAVPALVHGLKSKAPAMREFAAQALGMFADPSARPALERALQDPKATVRIYAIRALCNLGPLVPAEQYEELTNDPDRNVRATIRSALERKDKPDPANLRKAWAGYDLAKMGTARVGEPAPDFTLTSYTGKTYRLRDFRGKTVVLRYLRLDY